ncbi:MAG: hypothetical protein AB1601_16875 [Planctomycetota bacterium]
MCARRLIVGIAAAAASIALGDVVPVGDPLGGGSWTQQFYENGYWGSPAKQYSYDFLAIKIVSGGPFEDPALSGFTGGYNWDLRYQDTVPKPTVAGAGGNPIYGNMYHTIKFFGDAPGQGVLVYDYACFAGSTLLGTQRIYYRPANTAGLTNIGGNWWAGDSTWEPHRNDFIVPAPAAAMLGVIGLGLVGWVKRRLA